MKIITHRGQPEVFITPDNLSRKKSRPSDYSVGHEAVRKDTVSGNCTKGRHWNCANLKCPCECHKNYV